MAERLIIDPNNTSLLVLVESGGRHVHFTYNSTHGVWANESGKVRNISGDNVNGYSLLEPNGSRHNFDAQGRLIELRDKNNNNQLFAYTNGLLTRIVDKFGPALTLTYSGGLLSTLTTPIGAFTYEYDANGNLQYVHKPDTRTIQYIYDDPADVHNLTGIIDENGNRTLTVTYDATDRVLSSALAEGKDQLSIAYPSALQRVVTNSQGVATTYQLEVKNGIARVASFTGPGCSACGADTGSAYVYDDRQLITQVTDAKGVITTNTYDAWGNRNSKTEAIGTPEERTTSYVFTPGTDRVETITKASVANPGQQAVTTMTYDGQGNLQTRTETGYDAGGPISRSTAYGYDTYGRIGAIDGPRTDVQDATSFTYYPNDPAEGNNRANLRTVTNALGHATTYGNYNAYGKAELITPPFGEPIVLDYDAMGRLQTRSRGGQVTSYEYDAAGRLQYLHLPDNRTITYIYTPSGKPATVTDTLGNKISSTYNDLDQRIKQEINDPNNVLQYFVEYTYEQTGALDKTIQADASFEDLNYDAVGNLVARVNALNKTTEYRYDALNRLTAVVEPGSVTTGHGYDGNDNQIMVTDAEGKGTTFTYDDFGRKSSQTSPDTGLTTYQYDPADNLIAQTDANNVTTTYGYDALNRLTAVHYPDSARNVYYGYDANGQVGQLTSMQDSTGTTTYSYDLLGRLTGETRNQGGKMFSLAYAYNQNNELASITYPSGRVISYTRDSAGQITTVTSTFQGVAATVASNITHKPFGPRAGMTLGNNITVDASYNQLYRLTGVTAGTVYNRSYAYYPSGHVQGITDLLDPTASQAFTYDDLGRLDTAQGKYGSYTWGYDKVGNRTAENRDGAVTSYTYEPGTNRLAQVTAGPSVTDYDYDAGGNTQVKGETTFSWDQNNRLLSAAVNAATVGSYDYDGRGLRTKRTVNGATEYSVYDQAGNLLAELDGNGFVVREHVYLEGARLASYDQPTLTSFNVEVRSSGNQAVPGATVRAYTEAGADTGKSALTNAQGVAAFSSADLAGGNYTFRINYLDLETWSPAVYVRYSSAIQASLAIELEPVVIRFVDGGTGRAGAVVSVYSTTGQYLNLQGVTDSNGNVTFMLPQGRSFKFKIEYGSKTYWSDPLTVGDGGENVTVEDYAVYMPLLQLVINDIGSVTPLSETTLAGEEMEAAAEAGMAADLPAEPRTVLPAEKSGEPVVQPLAATAGGTPAPLAAVGAQYTIRYAYDIAYLISDHLGTAQVLVNSQGSVVWRGNYTPFGGVDVVVNQVANRFRFPGQYFDAETGLHYNWNRYYDPATGRYISADPIGLDGGMNLYAYVGGNPVNAVDFMGLDVYGEYRREPRPQPIAPRPPTPTPRPEPAPYNYHPGATDLGEIMCMATCMGKPIATWGAGEGTENMAWDLAIYYSKRHPAVFWLSVAYSYWDSSNDAMQLSEDLQRCKCECTQ